MTQSNEKKAAAFFDLDRTLIAGASAFVFARAARDAGHIRLQDFAADALRAIKFRFFGASDETSVGVRDRILSAVGGMKQSDLVALNDTVLPELLGLIRPEARALLEQHHDAGRETWIVSASPIEIVEPDGTIRQYKGGVRCTCVPDVVEHILSKECNPKWFTNFNQALLDKLRDYHKNNL